MIKSKFVFLDFTIYVISKNWLQVVLLVSVNDKGGSNEENFGNIVNRDFFIFS